MRSSEIDQLRRFFLKWWLVRHRGPRDSCADKLPQLNTALRGILSRHQSPNRPFCGEVAQKAIKEIATLPPRLLFYSIPGAVGLVLSRCARNVVALAI